MPISQIYWNGTEDSSYVPLIADLTIFASTNPKCANEAFNIVNGDYFCWKDMCSRVAAYFGANASSDQKFEKPFPTPGVPHIEIVIC
jgi:nucleoside-diphosphate-sugar epimerase